MYYVGTYEECEAYDEKVTASQNYDGVYTVNWCTPLPHPDGSKWAIIAHATEPDEESGLTLIEKLTDDWYSNEE
jgi:FlaG/FlaF family flagellin (archaellin)|tara:strand:+ start:5416 stop:5637 length:222 start_codon:yes stop_codon:yes gene_type:complete